MSKTFYVGEEKEIGIRVTSNDTTPFQLTATYEHKDNKGNSYCSGATRVDNHDAFVSIKPTTGMNCQRVIFKCTVIPLDSQGQVDVTKSVETIICVVPITVLDA